MKEVHSGRESGKSERLLLGEYQVKEAPPFLIHRLSKSTADTAANRYSAICAEHENWAFLCSITRALDVDSASIALTIPPINGQPGNLFSFTERVVKTTRQGKKMDPR